MLWGAVCLKITLGVDVGCDVYGRMRYLAQQSIFSDKLVFAIDI